uniref:Uncharacterized protein n=2 Tax=Arion vulgaris TaxID=1028688 RepID=A0A0B7B5B3_9EUPU
MRMEYNQSQHTIKQRSSIRAKGRLRKRWIDNVKITLNKHRYKTRATGPGIQIKVPTHYT